MTTSIHLYKVSQNNGLCANTTTVSCITQETLAYYQYCHTPPPVVRLSGESQLVVHHKVYCAAHIKVWEGGESKALRCYSLSGECCVSMYLEIQNLRRRGKEEEERRGGEGRGEEERKKEEERRK